MLYLIYSVRRIDKLLLWNDYFRKVVFCRLCPLGAFLTMQHLVTSSLAEAPIMIKTVTSIRADPQVHHRDQYVPFSGFEKDPE